MEKDIVKRPTNGPNSISMKSLHFESSDNVSDYIKYTEWFDGEDALEIVVACFNLGQKKGGKTNETKKDS